LIIEKRNCFFVGICNETSDTTFECLCQTGWTNVYCETKINYCKNVKCLNNGVCRSVLLNFTCECLGTSYSGRYCGITEEAIVTRQIVSKSFGYIAITFITCVAMFFVIMDVLKYFFGIDLTEGDSEKIQRRKKRTRKRKHRRGVQKPVYVVASL
jgi:hypothetical protein